MSIVTIIDNLDVAQAIRQALDPLPLDDLFTGKIVGVKPNETFASEKDLTASTCGAELAPLLAYIRERQPKRLIAAGGAGGSETDDVFRLCGMMDVVEQQGVEFLDLNRPPFVSVPLAFGPRPEMMVNELTPQIEVWVSQALLKVHELTKVTLSMKNLAMALPAADYYGHPRSKLSHKHDEMSDHIVGMVQRFPIRLALILGHPAMVDKGPIGGRTVETGLVIASTDPVAADAVGTAILGFDPASIRHIVEAAKLGLGEADLSEARDRGAERGRSDATLCEARGKGVISGASNLLPSPVGEG